MSGHGKSLSQSSELCELPSRTCVGDRNCTVHQDERPFRSRKIFPFWIPGKCSSKQPKTWTQSCALKLRRPRRAYVITDRSRPPSRPNMSPVQAQTEQKYLTRLRYPLNVTISSTSSCLVQTCFVSDTGVQCPNHTNYSSEILTRRYLCVVLARFRFVAQSIWPRNHAQP